MLEIINKTKNKDFDCYFDDIRTYYLKALKKLGLNDNFDLSLVLVGPKTIRKINREYRNIDKETDVISFALLDEMEEYEIPEENIELGDIFINLDRVISQAKEYEHSLKREFIFLFIHGVLHLLGYDHMNKEDEKVMFSLQKKIVGDLK